MTECDFHTDDPTSADSPDYGDHLVKTTAEEPAAWAELATRHDRYLAGVARALIGPDSQRQTDCVLYRSTAEALTHERFGFLARAHRLSVPDRYRALAAHIEELVLTEEALWSNARGGVPVRA